MILIAGGGLAGLSAAHCLEKERVRYLLLERENGVGGLCRSLGVEGYTFDYSGHLLCCRDAAIGGMVAELLGGQLRAFQRRASIFIHGSSVPYPFQAHLGFLPPEIMKECLDGFLAEAANGEPPPSERDYASWVTRAFGAGMARHFFFPYCRKLWGIPPQELSVRGIEWSIPRPSVDQVVGGSRGEIQAHLGYNPTFLYPSHGGIETLARALARGLSAVRTGCGVGRVLWQERVAVTQRGERVPYDRMVSTIALPHLLGMLHPRPEWLAQMAERLRWVTVWVLNVGVRRADVSDQHWIYFPESRYPFFRVGCYTAFGPHLAPPGCSALYVEVSGHTVEALGPGWVQACLRGLVASGLLGDLGEVDVADPLKLPVAYVVHDHARLEILPRAMAFLEAQGIRCAGRYGAWGYGTMEEAMIQGQEAAQWSIR